MAVDYTVTGTNTASNGNGNPTSIMGIGDTLTLVSDGLITVANQNGIDFSSGSMNEIENYGRITTQGIRASGISSLGTTNISIINHGTIHTDGMIAHGIYNSASSDATIINLGQIETFGMAGDGIHNLRSTGTTIINRGSIRVSTVNTEGILSTGDVTVINSGSVFAATPDEPAILLSAGSDNLFLEAGSRIQGRMNLNNGADQITLDHGGRDIAWRWTFDNFDDGVTDTLTVLGAPFLIETPGDSAGNGLTVTVADLSRTAYAAALLSDLSDAIAALATGRRLPTAIDQEPSTRFWATGFASHQTRAANGHAQAHAHLLAGGAVGVERDLADGRRLGLFGGAAQSALDGNVTELNSQALFASLYGQMDLGPHMFLTGMASVGYAQGGDGDRLRANNLVDGGLETISGGEMSGAFVISEIGLGAHLDASSPFAAADLTWVPSLTLRQASQWQEAYAEDGIGVQSVEGRYVGVITTRAEMAVQLSAVKRSGLDWTAALAGGVSMSADISDEISLSMGTETFRLNATEDTLALGGYLGARFQMSPSDALAVNFGGEVSFSDQATSDAGLSFRGGLSLRF